MSFPILILIRSPMPQSLTASLLLILLSSSSSPSGIDLLNISLDTLQPHKFEIMTRRKGHQRVMDAIDTAVEMGFDPVKVRRASSQHPDH